jgi:peptide/nickel transport system ATP-binding protein
LSTVQNILEIKDLYVNFYTKSGVVKALDGIYLNIKRGETFGLVGESGCGKSVTANCVLRLISTPPGKIEKGEILYTGEVYELEESYEALVKEKGANDPESIAVAERLENLTGRKLKENLDILEQTKGKDAPETEAARKQLAEVNKHTNVLTWEKERLQGFRGKTVSMIFQEPMSALNPVFHVGEQISESLLLHEKAELAKAVLRNIDSRVKEIDEYHHEDREQDAKGELKCRKCGAISAPEVDMCPQCGGSFSSDPLRALEKVKLGFYRSYYVKMVKEPNARSLRYAAKVPFLRRYFKLAKKEAMTRSEMMLRLVRIPDPKNVVTCYPHELSGGMQQRVMIAMALACRPKLLIADEPTTALDVTIQAQILKLMKDLQEETGTAILMITHNLGVVAEICDRVGVMYAGTMAEIGPTMDVFKEPLHPYTQGLMNLIPKVNVEVHWLETIEGTVPNLIKPPSGCRFHPRCPYAMEICKKEKPNVLMARPDHMVACHLYTGVVS